MTTPCHNSMMADRYAHEQGLESEREIWLERERDSLIERLDSGDKVWLSYGSYTKGEILGENMEPYDFQLLAQVITLGDKGTAHLKELNERLEQIVLTWVDKNIESILATEKADDCSDYDALSERFPGHMTRSHAA